MNTNDSNDVNYLQKDVNIIKNNVNSMQKDIKRVIDMLHTICPKEKSDSGTNLLSPNRNNTQSSEGP
jgi:hypothetical protein